MRGWVALLTSQDETLGLVRGMAFSLEGLADSSSAPAGGDEHCPAGGATALLMAASRTRVDSDIPIYASRKAPEEMLTVQLVIVLW
jgi:hypothetical protein